MHLVFNYINSNIVTKCTFSILKWNIITVYLSISTFTGAVPLRNFASAPLCVLFSTDLQYGALHEMTFKMLGKTLVYFYHFLKLYMYFKNMFATLKFQFLQFLLLTLFDQTNTFLFILSLDMLTNLDHNWTIVFLTLQIIGCHPMSQFTAANGAYIPTFKKYQAALCWTAFIQLNSSVVYMLEPYVIIGTIVDS